MAEFKYTERADYEIGFSNVYDAKIAPYLREQETLRLKAASRRGKWIWVVAGITAFLAYTALSVHPVLPIFPIFFGGGLALFLYLSRFDGLREDAANHIRPILCDFFEDVTYSDLHPGEGFSLSNMRELNLVPDADDTRIGPSISGTWRNTAYRLTQAGFYKSYRDSDNKRRTNCLFSGILLEIDCPIEMPTTVFYPDFGETMNTLYSWATQANRPPHKLSFPDAEVEAVFEVYTDDIEATKAHLDPGFGRKLLAFAQEYQARKQHISAAFQGRRFFMAISLEDGFMKLDIMDRPLHQSNDKISAALADLMIPRDIIDRLFE